MCEIICPQIILVRRNYGISLVLMIYIYIIYIYISSLKKSFSLFMTLFPKILFRAYFKWLLLKPGARKTWTQKNLDPEKPGLWKAWTQKNLDSEIPGPWKIWKSWIMKNAGSSWMQQKDQKITWYNLLALKIC